MLAIYHDSSETTFCSKASLGYVVDLDHASLHTLGTYLELVVATSLPSVNL